MDIVICSVAVGIFLGALPVVAYLSWRERLEEEHQMIYFRDLYDGSEGFSDKLPRNCIELMILRYQLSGFVTCIWMSGAERGMGCDCLVKNMENEMRKAGVKEARTVQTFVPGEPEKLVLQRNNWLPGSDGTLSKRLDQKQGEVHKKHKE